MKLFEVPEGATVRVIGDVAIPPESLEIKLGDVLYFHHIDGMYAYCKNKDGAIVYPAAWTEVEQVEDLKCE